MIADPGQERLTTGASLGAALLASLTRPSWWALALAGFLLRGGWLLVVLPIVPLPTTAGLANAVGPTLVGFVFGGASASFLLLAGILAASIVAWFIASGAVGGWLELGLVRGAAEDDELEGQPSPTHGDGWRAFAVRAVAHIPTAVLAVAASARVVEATYAELIAPGDPTLAVPLRVALRIPETVAALVAAWLLGETVGGLAVRHLAWGAGIPAAIGRGIASLARPSALVTLAVTTLVVAMTLLGSTAAIGTTWEQLRIALLDGAAASDVRLALVIFSLTWAVGLWLLAVATTWRSAAWTFEVGRLLAVGDHRPTLDVTSRGSSVDPGVLAR